MGGQNPILLGENNGMFGRPQSDFCKKRVSETQSGIIRSKKFRDNRREYMTGKHWYHNLDGDEKYFGEDDAIPNGYIPGRLPNKLLGENNGMYGKHHSEESKAKISKASSGENNGMYGKSHSSEAKKKISEFRSGSKKMRYGETIKIIKKDDIDYYLSIGWEFYSKRNKINE